MSLINNYINNTFVSGSSDSDSINNRGKNVSISAGAGNDYVYSNGVNLNTTINGGTGDDTFSNYQGFGSVYIYKAGDGNDVIFGFDGDDTLLITGGSWSKTTGDFDVVITVGKEQITLKRAATLSDVNITSSDKDIHPITTIQSTQADKLITGTNYRDSVYNSHSNITIKTGDGDDTVKNNNGDSVKVDMGDGNDSIDNEGSFVTINGGKGNDEISLSDRSTGVVINYNVGDGNDTVYNYNPSDMISLTGGSVENVAVLRNDLVLLTNNGAIRFVDTHAVNVNGTIYGDVNTKGTSDDDEIVNFTAKAKIKGDGGNDLISNGGAKVSINTGDGNNTVSNYGANTTIQVGHGENTVYNYDSATIQGNAGNDSLKLYGERINLNAGAGNDYMITTRTVFPLMRARAMIPLKLQKPIRKSSSVTATTSSRLITSVSLQSTEGRVTTLSADVIIVAPLTAAGAMTLSA